MIQWYGMGPTDLNVARAPAPDPQAPYPAPGMEQGVNVHAALETPMADERRQVLPRSWRVPMRHLSAQELIVELELVVEAMQGRPNADSNPDGDPVALRLKSARLVAELRRHQRALRQSGSAI